MNADVIAVTHYVKLQERCEKFGWRLRCNDVFWIFGMTGGGSGTMFKSLQEVEDFVAHMERSHATQMENLKNYGSIYGKG